MSNARIRAALLLTLAAPLHAAQPGDYEGALQEYQARSADEQAVMARETGGSSRGVADIRHGTPIKLSQGDT